MNNSVYKETFRFQIFIFTVFAVDNKNCFIMFLDFMWFCRCAFDFNCDHGNRGICYKKGLLHYDNILPVTVSVHAWLSVSTSPCEMMVFFSPQFLSRCWLSQENYFIWAFIAPMLLIILVGVAQVYVCLFACA